MNSLHPLPPQCLQDVRDLGMPSVPVSCGMKNFHIVVRFRIDRHFPVYDNPSSSGCMPWRECGWPPHSQTFTQLGVGSLPTKPPKRWVHNVGLRLVYGKKCGRFFCTLRAAEATALLWLEDTGRCSFGPLPNIGHEQGIVGASAGRWVFMRDILIL